MVVYVSLVVNIFVAGFWGIVLSKKRAPRFAEVFGPDTFARRVLACLYLAIAAASIVALIDPSFLLPIVSVLFPLQIGYKIATLFLTREPKNPVVISNLAIAALHAASLYILFVNR